MNDNRLGMYVGARLMTTWSVSLNVYGAEESPEYEFDQQVLNIPLTEALRKLAEYQKIIDDNCLDAYLSIDSMRGSNYCEGDLEQITEELFDNGIISRNDVEALEDMSGKCFYFLED